MALSAKLRGAMGEAYVAAYFRKKRYKVLAMNHHTYFGELDVIVAKRKKLIFVEVKLRQSGGVARAADSVTRAKQQRLRASAEIWLKQNPGYARYEMSFAVAEVYISENDEVEAFELLENAF